MSMCYSPEPRAEHGAPGLFIGDVLLMIVHLVIVGNHDEKFRSGGVQGPDLYGMFDKARCTVTPSGLVQGATIGPRTLIVAQSLSRNPTSLRFDSGPRRVSVRRSLRQMDGSIFNQLLYYVIAMLYHIIV